MGVTQILYFNNFVMRPCSLKIYPENLCVPDDILDILAFGPLTRLYNLLRANSHLPKKNKNKIKNSHPPEQVDIIKRFLLPWYALKILAPSGFNVLIDKKVCKLSQTASSVSNNCVETAQNVLYFLSQN